MRKKNYVLIPVILFAAILFISNPHESKYLAKIHHDHSNYHSEYSLSTETIKNIGVHERVTYLLFSTYSYRFGKRKAYYFGIANNVFFLGSKRYSKREKEMKVV